MNGKTKSQKIYQDNNLQTGLQNAGDKRQTESNVDSLLQGGDQQ